MTSRGSAHSAFAVRNRAGRGTGLELAIAREIVALNDGAMTFGKAEEGAEAPGHGGSV